MSAKKNRNIPQWMKEYLGEFCKVCGTTEKVEYHHIVPVSWGGETTIQNLVPLCRNHHMELHRLLNNARFAKTEQEYADAMAELDAFFPRRFSGRGQRNDTGTEKVPQRDFAV